MAEPAASWVPAVNPQGEIVDVPAADLPRAYAQGFRPPSPEQLAKIRAFDAASEQPLQAFGEGAASALTFGLAPKAEVELGITTPEAIAARREANPLAHGAGTVAGIAAPLLLTGGASGAAQAAGGVRGALAGAAELTAPALIARAGRAVAGGAAEAGLSRFAAGVSMGVTEGALYAGADVTEKALLGDPQLTWEKAATEVGLGALFGGALAGGTDLAAKGLGKLLGKGMEGLSTVAERVAKGEPETVKLMFQAKGDIAALEAAAPGAAEAIAASTPETARFILQNKARILEKEARFPGLTDVLARAEPDTAKLILDGWDKMLKDPLRRIEAANTQAEAVQTAYTSLEKALRTVNRDVRPAEMQQLASRANPDAAAARFAELQGKVEDLARKMRAEPDLYQSGAARELELIAEGLKRDAYAEAPVRRLGTSSLKDVPLESVNLAEGRSQARIADIAAAYEGKKPPGGGIAAASADELPAIKVGRDDAGRVVVPDGQHRLHVAREKGAPAIRAELSGERAAWQQYLAPGERPMFHPDRGPAELFDLLNRTKQLIDAQAKFGKTIAPEWRRTADALKGLRTEFRDALEDAALWGAAGERQASFNAAQNAYFTARERLQKQVMQKATTASGAVTFEVAPTKVNAWVNAMADGRGSAKSDAFGEYLRSARKLVDEMEKSGHPGAKDLRAAVQQITETTAEIRQRGVVSQIYKQLTGSGDHGIIGSGPVLPTKVALAAAQKLPGGVGHLVGQITGTITKVRDPGKTVGVLAALEKLAGKASSKLQVSADGIFAHGTAAAGAAGAERVTGALPAAKFPEAAAQLRDLGGNLDKLAEQVGRETGPMQDHAPGAATAAHAFAARAVDHLGQKLPDGGPRQLLDRPYQPSATEMAAYNRHHEVAAGGPRVVLEHIARGTLHPDHLAAAQALYPKLLAEAQQVVAERLATAIAKKQPIPMHVRAGLELFLGTPLTHSSTPAAILSAQAAYGSAAGAPEQPGGAGKGKPRNVQLKLSEHAATGSQGVEARMKRG